MHLTLFRNTRKSGMENYETVHISRVARVPSDTARDRGCRVAVKSLSKSTVKTHVIVLCDKRAENDENRAFLGNDHCISHDPQWISRTNFHHLIELSCATLYLKAQKVLRRVHRKSSISRVRFRGFFDWNEIWLIDLIFNLKLLTFSVNPSFIGNFCQTCCLIISVEHPWNSEFIAPPGTPHSEGWGPLSPMGNLLAVFEKSVPEGFSKVLFDF